MSNIVIRVENLGKRYTITHEQRERYTALRDVLTNGAKRLTRKLFSPITHYTSPITGSSSPLAPATREDFWALREVSFEIRQGDRVGIIGRNGAGKTTLLRLLSRITEPSTGRIMLKGRVASLLEVGTGFHPELTGRENIYLNGAILGMHKAEIKSKFDEIVDFAEIEKFLDTPVKRYSSGMYVRLAFAVAAHLEPEILLVDEVLAVGDAQFQKKCLGKMEDVSTKEGRTVLFVSHNMQAVETLCDRGIFLEAGNMIKDGEASAVVREYILKGVAFDTVRSWDNSNAPGNMYFKLLQVKIIATNNSNGEVYAGESFGIEFVFFKERRHFDREDLTFHLFDERGLLVFVGSTGFSNFALDELSGTIKLTCTIPRDLMDEGTYSLRRLFFVKDFGTIITELKDVFTFSIKRNIDKDILGGGLLAGKEGVVKPSLEWRAV